MKYLFKGPKYVSYFSIFSCNGLTYLNSKLQHVIKQLLVEFLSSQLAVGVFLQNGLMLNLFLFSLHTKLIAFKVGVWKKKKKSQHFSL